MSTNRPDRTIIRLEKRRFHECPEFELAFEEADSIVFGSWMMYL
jgi:hypothetical protein